MRKSRSPLALGFVLFLATSIAAAKTFEKFDLQGRESVTGRALSLSLRAASRGTVVVFLSAKCPCSIAHEGVIRQLHQEFSSQGFQFVGIHSNADESEAMTKSHFGEGRFGFPILRDDEARIANRLGALKTPHAYLLSPEGNILFQGGVDDSTDPTRSKTPFLREALLAVRDGKPISTPVARALGCVIKRSD